MASAGTTQDLNEGRAQALQALLHSISQEGASSVDNDQHLTPDQVKKISDKLEDLLRDTEIGADGGQRRNQKGEMVNEEGLPIVDLREPVHDAPSPTALSAAPENIFDDPDLLPPWALSPAEKARRRAERERILDLLEEEERVQEERAQAADRERWLAELERRKEAAKTEMDNIKKARELQKKMGKALLRNVTETREREENERAAREKEEREAREARQKLKPKKSVSFADLPVSDKVESEKDEARSGLGSVALARLERKGKSPLMTKAEMDRQPMRMHVVERHPGAMQDSLSRSLSNDQDSDDESVPGSPVHAHSDEGEVIHTDHSDDHEVQPAHSESEESEAEPVDDDEPVGWDEEEFDFARHQREIALAYYEKRATIASDVSSAMRAHTHEEPGNEWDQPEVPLEVTLASPPPKPTTSRFKAEHSSRAPSSFLASHSLGSSLIPSSQSSSLKHAVRMGKLVNGQLLSGEAGDSGDEGDMEVREILELLSKGQVTNVGPDASSVHQQLPEIMVAGPSGAQRSTAAPPVAGEKPASEPEEGSALSKPKPSKVSKFKLALSQVDGQSHSGAVSPESTPDTPRSVVARSSPKSATPPAGTPIATPLSVRPSGRALSPPTQHIAAAAPLVERQGQMPSMIVDSPSFATGGPSQVVSPFFSTIIESPSFTTPSSASTLVESLSFQSPDIASPPLQSPALSSPSLTGTPPEALSPDGRAGSSPTKSAVLVRPVGVMAAEVRESSAAPRRDAEVRKERKVSRFLAERS